MADIEYGTFEDAQGNPQRVNFADAQARASIDGLLTRTGTLEKNYSDMNVGIILNHEQMLNDVYGGRNLTEVFDNEIQGGYSNAWEWCADRVDLHYYNGLLIKDYIPTQIDSNTLRPCIMGFDHDTGIGSTEQTNGIYFFENQASDETTQWNTTNNNNGTSAQNLPYLVSNLYSYIIGTRLLKYPSAVRAVMGDRTALLEKRYSSSTLTESNGWDWGNMGRLWPLDEVEVFGRHVWSGPYSGGASAQFDLFRKPANRIMRNSNGARRSWWLRSVHHGYSTYAGNVTSNGLANSNYASNSYSVACGFKVVAS